MLRRLINYRIIIIILTCHIFISVEDTTVAAYILLSNHGSYVPDIEFASEVTAPGIAVSFQLAIGPILIVAHFYRAM